MSARRGAWALAVVALLLVLAAGAVYVGRDTGLVALPGRESLHLSDPAPTTLDTVAIDGRRVTTAFDGVVRQIDTDGTVWLEWGADAFALRGALPDSVAVEDRALVVGRLRSWRGRRWVAVEAWAPVTRSVH